MLEIKKEKLFNLSFKEKAKRLWKPFFAFFIIAFLVLNWSEISWMFNYQVVSRFFSELLQGETNEIEFDFSQGGGSLNSEDFEYSDKENGLEIPKINIEAPLIFPGTLDGEKIHEYLNEGVVWYPDSALPGTTGQTIILGHSAPPGWPKIKYDWVFTHLIDMEKGDEIFVYFNNRKYTYEVKEKLFFEKGEEVPEYSLTNSENVLILISCWPPGKDIRRIGVSAELKNK